MKKHPNESEEQDNPILILFSSPILIITVASIIVSVFVFIILLVKCFNPVSPLERIHLDYHNITVKVEQFKSASRTFHYIDFDNRNEETLLFYDDYSATLPFIRKYHCESLRSSLVELFPKQDSFDPSDSSNGKELSDYDYKNTFRYLLTQAIGIIKSSKSTVKDTSNKNSTLYQIYDIPYPEELLLIAENSISDELFKKNYNSIDASVSINKSGDIVNIFFIISSEDNGALPYSTIPDASIDNDSRLIVWTFSDINKTKIHDTPYYIRNK